MTETNGKIYENISETTLVKLGSGTLKGIMVNSHTSGTIKLIDGLANGAQATGVLTSSGALVASNYATGTITSDATNVSDGDTVVLGATGGTPITYRFKTTPSQAYDVKIGANASATLDNLKSAINATGAYGTDYFAGTLVNPDVIAYTKTATTLKIAFRTIGTAGNAYTTTETSTHLSWGGGTLSGGVATTNSTITIGDVTYTVTLTLSDTIGLTGANSVANQILWVTSEAVFLDNLKSAINQSGVSGTDYSSATVVHPTVYATTNTNTAQTIVAKQIGTVGNAIATTETLANYAWGGALMTGGTGTTGYLMHNTMTLSATATTGERWLEFGNEIFGTGLLVVIGGTADLTVVYDNN